MPIESAAMSAVDDQNMSAEEDPDDTSSDQGDLASSPTHKNAALLYAIFVAMVGFILPLSTYATLNSQLQPFSPWSLIGFQIAIYSVAIAFLLYFVLWIARRPPISLATLRGGGHANQAATGYEEPGDAPTVSTQSVRQQQKQQPQQQQRPRNYVCACQNRANTAALIENARQLGVREIPACCALPQADSQAPTFFMRVACFIFGSLKVTHESMRIVDVLTDAVGGCGGSKSGTAGLLIQFLLRIVFTVLQTFFIFKYGKVSVNVYRTISSLGFMHLVATNLCDWFHATLMETSHSDYKSESRLADRSYNGSSSSSKKNSSGCSKDVFWRLAPYLLPFTIEYALLAAVSAYALHENVGKFFTVLHQRGAKGTSVLIRCLRKCRGRTLGQSQISTLNCLRSGRGIVIGSLLLIAGIVSGIYFTVYINDKPSDPVTSQLIFQATDLVLLSGNLALCIVAYVRMRHLTPVHGAHSGGPDAWLLGITLIGVLGYQLYQLFGSAALVGFLLGVRLTECLLAIIQSIFQVFLIFEVEHRHCRTAKSTGAMPGREEMAALMLGNISLWIVYTLQIREITSLPTYSDVYSPVATDIITYSCSPLIIFFRFHSACCFVEIWRTTYKTRARNDQDVGSRDSLTTVDSASNAQLDLTDRV